MLKIGEKYRCKKSHNFNYTNIIENNYYIIDHLDKYWVRVEIDSKRGIALSYTSDDFYDYFYSKQEERKLKLEKLCTK
jgi:hypothetical protein